MDANSPLMINIAKKRARRLLREKPSRFTTIKPLMINKIGTIHYKKIKKMPAMRYGIKRATESPTIYKHRDEKKKCPVD